MALIKASVFLKREFRDDSRMTKTWIEESVDKGVIPGIRLGYETFIDERAWESMLHKALAAWGPRESEAGMEKHSEKEGETVNPLLEALRRHQYN